MVNVPAMLEVLEKEAASLSGERLQLEFDIDKSLRVLADEDQLRSAISNLVYNAVKYTPPGATVKVVGIRPVKAHVWMCQILETYLLLHRLTERFYRVDKARSRDTGGSGLGLAIVKHALSHHDSHLEIQSEVGVGSRFHCAA
ncbi:ATP-binding protein [Enterovibrio norvegicus]|uniref:ATP-binding protein n=1 Tax=Enterovibrio norvegicus TaxID=188144 RepID=UPI0039B03D21